MAPYVLQRNSMPWTTKRPLSLTLLLMYSVIGRGASGDTQTPLPVIDDQIFDEERLHVNTTSGRFTGFVAHRRTPHPVDVWLGIPFAERPTGALRFKPPIPLINSHSSFNRSLRMAWKFGDACPQPASPDIPVPISEDCLSLNIYRPARSPRALSSHSSRPLLPTLVWVHGGGLSYGTSAQYDGTTIVSHGHKIGKPILLITINYRLNSFGFLNSEALPLTDLSVGLKDQIAALKWLQANLKAFGGNPQKVTIWGQSAGGFSVSLLMTYLPRTQTLFRAAIMDSGAPTSHTVPPVSVYDLPGLPFDLLTRFTGCDQEIGLNVSPEESIECLRRLPMESLIYATNAVTRYGPYRRQVSVWGPCWKPGSFIDKRPSKRLQNGQFLNMPVLMGTNKDEGTLFAIGAGLNSPHNVSDKYFFDYMSNSSILNHEAVDSSVFREVAKLYPDDPEVGSPFETGNKTFGLPSKFKRLAAWFGDLHYQAPRRFWASRTSKRQDTYVYFFNGPRNSSSPLYAGVPHSSEIQLIFGSGWYQDLGDDEKMVTHQLAEKMRTYYIDFVYDLNPGPDWPLYEPSRRLVMKLDKYNSSVIKDDWRMEQISYLNSQQALDTFNT
ncbi:carboxylesterase [Melampsora americana]|nr:carboxylesterase [Melampsora americana]